MSDLKHNVQQGAFSHEVCGHCFQDGTGVKAPIDEGLLSITRVRFCESFEDSPVNFNVMLMADHKVTKKLEHIVRACSSHANYHWHMWNYLKPKKPYSVREFGTIDSVDRMASALGDAQLNILEQAIEWRESWLPKKY